MSDRQASVVQLPGASALDSDGVLDRLRELIREAASPVVQECLRDARKEIAFLTANHGPFPMDEATWDEQSDEDVIRAREQVHQTPHAEVA